MAGIIIMVGLIVSRLENWPKFDSVYWAFITATTVGYGDMRPKRKASRILAILISFNGLIFTGILIAIAVEAVGVAFELHIPKETLQQLEERIKG